MEFKRNKIEVPDLEDKTSSQINADLAGLFDNHWQERLTSLRGVLELSKEELGLDSHVLSLLD